MDCTSCTSVLGTLTHVRKCVWIKNGVIWVDTVYSMSLTRLELLHVYPISASWFPGLLIVLSNNYSSAKLGSKYNTGIGVASCVSG